MSLQLRPTYDHIYLSPHLDDAVLSCGGQIFQQTAAGDSVLIVTVTAGDPPTGPLSPLAQELHDRWAAGVGHPVERRHMVARRRAEDTAACDLLRADYLYWPVLDCIYRANPATGAFLYTDTPSLFGELDPAEEPLIDQLATRLIALPPADQIYIPLGVGNHVDHQLTRQAAERAARDGLYYEEYPYVAAPGALDKALPPDSRSEWAAVAAVLGEPALVAKVAAITTYDSQLSSFFVDRADLEKRVRAIARRVWAEAGEPAHPAGLAAAGAERYWRRL